MLMTVKYVILYLNGTIFKTRGLVLILGLIWVAFPVSSNCDLAVGVAQGDILMSWRTNLTDISGFRYVVNPSGVNIIRFLADNVTGTPVTGYTSKVTDIGNVSLGIVSFRLLSLTVADAGKYYYKIHPASYDGGHLLVIAGYPANISVMQVADPFENEKYTIQCSAQSTSVPPGMGLTMNYQWKNEKGQNITASDRYTFSSGQSNLNINPLKRQDSGIFVCAAWEHDEAVSQSGPFSLNVFYGPDTGSINLSPNRTFQEVAESCPFSVNCSTDCFPDCQYRWTGPGGSNPSNTGFLSIISIGRIQIGQYTCTASNSRIPRKTAAATVNVVVFYGPDERNVSLSPSNTSYWLPELSSLAVQCTATCVPQCDYQWSGPLVNQNDNTGLLSISQISRNHTGTFTCTVTNPRISGKSATANFFVTVYYGPDIPHLSPSTTVYTKLEGESVPDINCSADCFPGCTQVWMKGVTAVQESSGNTLSLGQVYRDKAGDYTCWVNNTESKATGYTSIRLVVQYPPVLTMKATNTSKGDRMVINCTASGVPDNYTFYKLTHMAPDVSRTIVRELEPTRVSVSEVSFTIDGATYQDTGFYVCKASNGITHFSTGQLIIKDMVSIWITDQPIIISNPRDFDAEKGKSGHMHIEFYSGQFQPFVTWYIIENGTMELLKNSSNFRIYLSDVTVDLHYYQKTVQLPGYNASLEVFDVNEEQFASYQMEINISFAEPVFVTLQLKPRGPPETPANLSVVPDSVTSHSLQLSWRPGFDGGASQTFVIEYREVGETNWIYKSEDSQLVLYVTLNTTITDLKDGTTYEFRIYSENVYNRSQVSSAIIETTKTAIVGEDKFVDPIGSSVVIGAAAGSALVLVIAVVIVGFLFYRRRQSNKSPEEDVDVQDEKSLSDGRESGLLDNPVYDSSGPLPGPSTSGSATGAEFDRVIKHKKKGGHITESGNVYAQVDKTKKGNKTGQVKENYGKTPRVDIYENATLPGRGNLKGDMYVNSGDLKADENVYEYPREEASKGSIAKKDGVMYADLVLDPPTTKNGKYIIRGLDNLTEYAEIAYGKRVEPLPDSNEEK